MTAMKLVVIDCGAIGLLVELPAGPHVIDLANSLGALAGFDLVSGGLINGVLKEKSVWGALVANWQYLRLPLARLAGIAIANPDHPCLVLYRLADCRQSRDGIVALDITFAPDLSGPDQTGRSPHSNVTVRFDGMIPSGSGPASSQVAKKSADVVAFPRPKRVREKAECSGAE